MQRPNSGRRKKAYIYIYYIIIICIMYNVLGKNMSEIEIVYTFGIELIFFSNNAFLISVCYIYAVLQHKYSILL